MLPYLLRPTLTNTVVFTHADTRLHAVFSMAWIAKSAGSCEDSSWNRVHAVPGLGCTKRPQPYGLGAFCCRAISLQRFAGLADDAFGLLWR